MEKIEFFTSSERKEGGRQEKKRAVNSVNRAVIFSILPSRPSEAGKVAGCC